jgi:1,4-dihydroxy-2-naphthoyl-CoA hydrolase
VSLWVGDVAGIDLPAMAEGTLIESLGIEIVELRDDALVGRMPVDGRTVQPAGVLHGGASVALAETLASWAGYLAVDRSTFHVVGQEINANHIRPVFTGWVTATATPVAIGRRSQVWEIRIVDEAGKLVCISRCTLAVIEQRSTYGTPGERGSA